MAERDDVALIAALNDLLQLEHDALPSYRVAISALHDESLRRELEAHRDDHVRHVRELTAMIEERDAAPLAFPHLPTGLLKLGLQAAAFPGGDRAVLLAFRANEWQSREKYARAVAEVDLPEIRPVLERAAEDEARHYRWAVAALDRVGLGDGTLIGKANGSFARFHGTVAEIVERTMRTGMEAIARTSRSA